MMTKDNSLSILAKSYYWQTIYSRSKEIGTIQIFKNNSDFTQIQLRFLQELEMFDILFTDLFLQEINISNEVINDPIRREAYLLWKRKVKNSKDKKERVRDKEQPFEHIVSDIPAVEFINKKK